ncbi:MAG: ABC transporter ATP-binding protein [Thermodesulfobacteriota bacterium]|nr:ABC transporter ATP-binding protein [Thermodesulfobacteriota bacterium]
MYLQIINLTVLYDRATVLSGVNLNVDLKGMVSLVGPNGAGKTTLLRAIAGLVKWEIDTLKGTTIGKITLKGSVLFDGKEILHLPAHQIARKGVVLCPERGKLFYEMTVKENLYAGAYLVKDRHTVNKSLDHVYFLFPILKERENQISGKLSGGERTMLSIGRALMSQAKLLLVDEPSVGLASKIKTDLFSRISDIHGMGITILLAEQDVGFAFELASMHYVMSRGRIIGEGTASELLGDEKIRETYLGL